MAKKDKTTTSVARPILTNRAHVAENPDPTTPPAVGVPAGTAKSPIEVNFTIKGETKENKITFEPLADKNGYRVPTGDELKNELKKTLGREPSADDISKAEGAATAALITKIGADNITLTGNIDKWAKTIKEWRKAGSPTEEDITKIINKSPNSAELLRKANAPTPAKPDNDNTGGTSSRSDRLPPHLLPGAKP